MRCRHYRVSKCWYSRYQKCQSDPSWQLFIHREYWDWTLCRVKPGRSEWEHHIPKKYWNPQWSIVSSDVYAYLIMNRNSSIYFIENETRTGGGAICVNENGLNSYLVGGFQDCFIHFTYNNFNLCEDCSDLDNFGVFIKFSGNTAAAGGSMVSGSSLVTCPWVYDLIANAIGLDQSVLKSFIKTFQMFSASISSQIIQHWFVLLQQA